MLKLGEETLFGRGGSRDCHFHPIRDDRCLKVHRPDKGFAQLRAVDPFYKRLRPISHYDQNLRDFIEFKKLWARVEGIPNPPLPEVDGLVETSLGRALCMELIRDANGDVSQSLKEFIMQNGFTDQARKALDELERKHLECALLVRDPFPHNVLVQRLDDDQSHMLFIDGLGDSALIPINQFFKSAARKRIAKKFKRLRKSCEAQHLNYESGKNPEVDGNGILLKRQRVKLAGFTSEV